MSEPTVKIPVRLALRAARHFHHIAGTYLSGTTGARICASMSEEFRQHVIDQCSAEDLRVAAVAAELQEHA